MAITTSSITTRVNDGTGTWVDPGSGGGSGQNTDIFLSGTASRARKVSNATDKGYGFQINASGEDITGLVFSLRWTVTAGVGLLDSRTNGGVSVFVQDTAGDISYWDVDGNDTYNGGFKNTVLDMSVAASRNSGTAADLTIAEYVGMVWTTTAGVGGGDPNTYIDEILSWPQAGLTITGNTTAFIDDLVDVIDLDGSSINHNIFERRSGIVFAKARIIVQQDATDISETDRTLVFENPVYDAGSTIDTTQAEVGIENDNATAGELFTLTRCSLLSADPDEAVTTDANREFDFTSGENADFDTCVISGFDGTVMHLGGTSNSYTGCTIAQCSQIVDTGAVVRGGFIRDTQAAAAEAALLWTSSSDWQDTEFVMGASNSHAMEIETNITDSWTGFTFTGYNTTSTGTTVGDEVLNSNNPSGGTIINASDVTGVISWYQRGAGSDPTINSNVTVTFNTMRDDTEVRVYDNADGTTELDGIENATAGSADNRNFGASVAASTVVDYVIHNETYEYIRVNGFTWPSSTTNLPIQQRFDRNVF